MERYYNKPVNTKSRIKNNEELYRKIYEMGEYSNVEGIATIENGNDIDISKVQELLKMHEERDKRQKPRIEREPIKVEVEQMDEDRNYDIRDVLNKAKESNTNHDDKMRSLKNTEYDILKGLDLKKTSVEDVDLKDLINTITHNSALNKLASGEDTGSLLDDLISKSKTDTIDTKSISTIINDEKKKYEKDMDIDKSFYTSSFNFKEDDFETMADLNKNLKKRNKLIIILIVLSLILAGLLGAYLFIK